MEGDFIIRVDPDRERRDDVWGELTGTVDTLGALSIAVRVPGAVVNGFEALTGCTSLDGDAAFDGRVVNDTLGLSATFLGICVSSIDSSRVSTQWTREFTGVASPLSVGSAAVTISPEAVTLRSGTSLQLVECI
ncbi:MAG: hypothetical protein P8170_23185 [Gemmatimonadota bacterium]